MARGRLQQAKQHFQEGLDAHGDLSVAGVLHAGLGEIYYEHNEFVTARTHLEKALQMGEQGGEIKPIAYAQIALGALVPPEEAVQRLENLTRLTNWSLLYAWQAVWWLRAGHVSMAEYWLEDTQADDHILSEFERMVQARVLIALEAWKQAEKLLHDLAEAATQHQRWGDLVRILLLQARLATAQHKPSASTYVQEAIKKARLGENGGYLRTFIDEGEPILSLCSALGYSLSQSNHTKDLRVQAVPFGETLSAREVEILGLIADGASNEEIAQKLFLTVGTVKWHVHNIFGKLDVKNRTQAVKKAQNLGLLLV
jgi:LuxR family transcriptional regulator, maltose regulon positive regulatory protein